MATVTSTSQFTLLELAKRLGSSFQNVVEIANELELVNEWMKDATWMQANEGTSHKGTRTIKLPTGSVRMYNQGLSPSASISEPTTDAVVEYGSLSVIDQKLLDLSPDPSRTHSDEVMKHVEGLGQTISTDFFYGDGATGFMGLSPRVATVNSKNVYSNGDASNLSSIYVVGWNPRFTNMIYPRGSKSMGIDVTNKGKGILYTNSDGTHLPSATVDHISVTCGFSAIDRRFIGRVGNIDTSAGSFNENYLIKMLNWMPPQIRGYLRIYCNDTVKSMIDIRMKDKSNVYWDVQNVFGQMVTTFRGIPVRVCNSIINSESAIS